MNNKKERPTEHLRGEPIDRVRSAVVEQRTSGRRVARVRVVGVERHAHQEADELRGGGLNVKVNDAAPRCRAHAHHGSCVCGRQYNSTMYNPKLVCFENTCSVVLGQ